MYPLWLFNRLRKKDWVNHMSKLRDKVLKIVFVTRYALLRALFSFAKMSSLIFCSQLFQQSHGWSKDGLLYWPHLAQQQKEFNQPGMKDIVQVSSLFCCHIINKQTFKVICWYVYLSMVDLIHSPKIPWHFLYQKVGSVSHPPVTRENYGSSSQESKE